MLARRPVKGGSVRRMECWNWNSHLFYIDAEIIQVSIAWVRWRCASAVLCFAIQPAAGLRQIDQSFRKISSSGLQLLLTPSFLGVCSQKYILEKHAQRNPKSGRHEARVMI